MSDIKSVPFPQAIQEGEWIEKIEEGAPKLDKSSKTLTVALDNTIISRNNRCQIQAKIKWGELEPKETNPINDSIESLRLTCLLEKEAELDLSDGYNPIPQLLKSYTDSSRYRDYNHQFNLLVSNGNTKPGNYLKNLAQTPSEEKVFQLAEQVIEKITSSNLSIKERNTIVRWAKRELKDVLEEIKELDEKEDEEKAEKASKSSDKCLFDDEEEDEDSEDSDSSEEKSGSKSLTKSKEKILDDKAKDTEEVLKNHLNSFKAYTNDVKWAKLIWEKPPLVRLVKPKFIDRIRKLSDEGNVLRDCTRLLLDGKVWEKRSRQLGGAVLIDGSGSMSLSRKDVELLVELAPAVSIAVYSSRGTAGTIKILVNKGKMVAKENIYAPNGSGNGVDGPCIEQWLLLQSEPRIWVSDGMVTGENDATSVTLFEETLQLCQKGKVIISSNVPDTIALYKQLENGGGVVHPALAHRRNKEKLKR